MIEYFRVFSISGSDFVEVFVALNISLNATERLELVNYFYNGNISLNDSYTLTILIIINNVTNKLGKDHEKILILMLFDVIC